MNPLPGPATTLADNLDDLPDEVVDYDMASARLSQRTTPARPSPRSV
jgi:hypothetical protein